MEVDPKGPPASESVPTAAGAASGDEQQSSLIVDRRTSGLDTCAAAGRQHRVHAVLPDGPVIADER
jgi:hypothetical protein